MEDGYMSMFLEMMKVEVFEIKNDSVVMLENKEGVEIRLGDYNFEGFVIECGVLYEFREIENGYGSMFFDNIKIEILILVKDSVLILENIEGVEIKEGDYNFEGFVLEWGVVYEFKEIEYGYGSIFLDKFKIEIFVFVSESVVILGNSS